MDKYTLFSGISVALLFSVPWGLAEPFAYIADPSDNQVSVVDMQSYETIAKLFLGGGVHPPNPAALPKCVLTEAKTARVFIGEASGVNILDATSQSIAAFISVPDVRHLAVNAEGTQLYAIAKGGVQIIDLLKKQVVGSIHVGSTASAMALSPSGQHLYVVRTGDASETPAVQIIDTAKQAIETSIATESVAPGLRPSCLNVAPRGDRVYIIGKQEGPSFMGYAKKYLVLDTTRQTVKAVTPTGGPDHYGLIKGIVFDAEGSHVYFGGADFRNAVIFEIDTATDRVTRTLKLATGGAEYHYTTDLASVMQDKRMILAGFVFEHRKHSTLEPRNVTFVDVASGETLKTLSMDKANPLQKAELVGDILKPR